MKSENAKRLMSIYLGGLSLILGAVALVIPYSTPEHRFPNIHGFFILLSWFAAIAIGILAIKIGRSVKFKTGVIGGCIGVGFSAFFFIIMHLLFLPTISDGRMHCHREMQHLTSAIQQYCKQNEGSLPNAETWCDQLVETIEYGKFFSGTWGTDVTYGSGGAISEFAFNKNLDGYRLADINRKTVLLFETDRGWNQNSTSDILLPEGHPGYYVLFEGGSHFLFVGPDSTLTVEFIKNSEIDSVNWVK